MICCLHKSPLRIAKYALCLTSTLALAEEIADVEIMLEQLKVIFRNRALVDRIRAGKLVRLSDRITGEARE